MTGAKIFTFPCEVIEVNDNNDPAPDNFMHSDDVLPTPSSLTFNLEPQLDFWRQLGREMVENTLDEETEAGGGLWNTDERK